MSLPDQEGEPRPRDSVTEFSVPWVRMLAGLTIKKRKVKRKTFVKQYDKYCNISN